MAPDQLITRHNFFMQTTDVMFQQEPFASEKPESVKIEDVRIRHERQTLRRLPRSRAILFTVRTYILPIVNLIDEPESIRALLASVRAMPAAMGTYKGRDIWGYVVNDWCERQLKDRGMSIEME
jgi:hypothetical protein